ncbi:hypothetical protein PLESTB_000318800 [Pleodorina starrii]|uniref:Dilute domain-containing protein n=1 Tax=Pleodorina starrii TaxID=330485 RepID=A0A9W6BDP0_9CHLO|nr:hypothetical protein PLESTM_001740500 [Pleodorina starrii]GLC49880.1 hypothetical protein PLESTB_000318800 [Pleodorina starrii]GLC68249.1 hypothetical protein PLESTF_000666600 [Pleodorina starrii]
MLSFFKPMQSQGNDLLQHQEFVERVDDTKAERDEAVWGRSTAEQELAEVKVRMEKEVAALKEHLSSLEEEANLKVAAMATALKDAHDLIGRFIAERSYIEKKHQEMTSELVTRLQNACAQRDEARGRRAQELESKIAELTGSTTQQQAVRESAAATAVQVGQPSVAAVGATDASTAAVSAPASVGTLGAAAPADTTEGVFESPEGSAPTSDTEEHYCVTADTNVGGRLPAAEGVTAGQDEELCNTRSIGGLPAGTAGSTAGFESYADRRARLNAQKQMKQVKQMAKLVELRKAEEERLLAALRAPLPTSGSAQQAGAGPLGMGFHEGRPVAAIAIFRYCLHVGAFQADRTTFFDRVVGVIAQQLERGQEDNNCLSYWLTNTVTLHHLLTKNLKLATSKAGSGAASGGVAGTTAATTAIAATRSTVDAMFGSYNGVVPPGSLPQQAKNASGGGGGAGGVCKQVEARYPAMLFKQQLDAFVQKIFPSIRDNVRKEITPLLSYCIHSPGYMATGFGSVAHQNISHKPWADVLKVLDTLLGEVKANHVPKVLAQALFKQLFRFIDVQLFNQLLRRRECCSASNAEYLKVGLGKVARWISSTGYAGADYISNPWEELKHLHQAVTFLVTANKPKKSLEEITSDLCPVLSIQQLYRISTMYWDDKHNTETVSPEVLSCMKQAMVGSNGVASHSFLLDDDASVPFQELLANMDDKNLYGAIPVPEVLQDIACYAGKVSFFFLGRELR